MCKVSSLQLIYMGRCSESGVLGATHFSRSVIVQMSSAKFRTIPERVYNANPGRLKCSVGTSCVSQIECCEESVHFSGYLFDRPSKLILILDIDLRVMGCIQKGVFEDEEHEYTSFRTLGQLSRLLGRFGCLENALF